ncbi:uncharacterized protein [Dysidea avara]|uniref:uncharacterized protein isoform X2 n=1 Tax=Dysidea avara TaxID=196820 RepID=UPI00332BB366
MEELSCARACTPESTAPKRPRSSPTLLTPHRDPKRTPRTPLREKDCNGNHTLPRVLSESFDRVVKKGASASTKWSDAELKALTEFILFHSEGNSWPAHKRDVYWQSASEFVHTRSGHSIYRSGMACRFKVVGLLSSKFKTPKEAEVHYLGRGNAPVTEPASTSSQRPTVCASVQRDSIDVSTLLVLFKKLPEKDQLQAVSKMFTAYLSSGHCLVPEDFLIHAKNAMLQLRRHGRSNVLYNLAKGIGTMREDNSDSKFPTKCMPMGLVEYAANFFSCDNLQQVSCPLDYWLWQQTMYCHFGQKWSKLHHGPLWSVTFSAQSSESSHSSADQHSFGRNPLQALVNIPGISERTIRRDIASSEIHLNSQIQLTVLDEAAKSNPDAWWWLKADGCDITKGLKESVKLQWSGDVDLNDGSLQKQCDAYNKRLKMAENAGLDRNQAGEDFKNILKDLAEDLNFLNAELIRSNDVYSEKLHSNKYNDKDLINLSWKLKELGDLNEMGRKLHSDIDVLSAKIGEHQHSW